MRKSFKKFFSLIIFCVLIINIVFSNSVKVYAAVTVTTLVSSGLSGPGGVAVDSAGNVYIADTYHNAIKKRDTSGTVTTLVSSGLNIPYGVAVDSTGNVYIADTNNNAIKKRDTSGTVTALVSSGLSGPSGVAVDSTGNVYIADTNNNAIKKCDTSGTVTTLVSSGLITPGGVAVDSSGNVYIANTGGAEIKKRDISGTVTTLISFASGLLSGPIGVAVDSSGNMYIADTDSGIIKRTASGVVTNLSASVSCSSAGGIAVDSSGNVYFSDLGHNAIKEIMLNSTISSTTGNFDKNPANQVDVSTTMTLNGNTLSSITNGGYTLVSGTDYTVTGNTVTINKSYLSQQNVGTTNLTFNFSAGNTQTLGITVVDTTPQNSIISSTTGNFDKNTANQADISTTMTLNGNTLSSITNGGYTLVDGTDYTVSGNIVTIDKSYLSQQSVGTTNLTFNFSAGNTQTLGITVVDTTTQDSTISLTTGNFDKNTANQADISTTMTLNGNTLSSITNGGYTLVDGTDYTVTGNTVTINKSYLSQQSVGTTNLKFNFSAGNTQTLGITVVDTTSHNSTISSTTGNFDKNLANQADVSTTMTLNGNTLSSITNGGYTLVDGTDYTVTGNTVTIDKSYLSQQSVGITNLTFNFSAGNTQTLGITVVDTTTQDSTISSTTGNFDKNPANQADVSTTMTLNGNTLSSITNGGYTLVSGTDYTVSGNTVTIYKSYLSQQSVGTTNLTFNFSAGNTQMLEITVVDTTTQNSTISSTTGNFDKNPANQADVSTTMTLNGNTLSSITNGGYTLVSGTDYTVTGNTVTIGKSYLSQQSVGTTNLTFNFSAGNTQTLEITVVDTTTQNSTISSTTGNFDKNPANQADVSTTMTLNGNTLSSITNGGYTLVDGTDYTVTGNTVTIDKSYLSQQSVGTTNLTFNFSAGNTQTLEITVVDTTTQNSTISSTTGNFDKNPANQADVSTIMTLNGNTLSSITNGGYTLVSGTDYTVTANTVTIDKSYLAQQSVGTTNLRFNFSAGNAQTIAITVTDTTPTGASVTYTLNYEAGAGGTVEGESSQTVNEGASGREVTAVPNAGYHFVSWSDGNTNESRTDTNVTEDIRVNAEFEIDLPDNINATTPAAVTIEGTKRVGETLAAQLKDEDGNNFTTSAAVTYEWYRLDNSDCEFVDQIGTGRNYRLTGSDLSKYIGVRVTCGDSSFEYVIGRILAASSSSSHHHSTTTDTTTNTETKKDDNNIKKTGWTQETDDTKYYLKDDGSKTTGWKLIDNKWYFFNNRTGTMVKGWYKSEAGDWTFDKNDTVGQWFHLDSDGKLTLGWLKDTDGNWYYLCNANAYGALGVMLTGWQHINEQWYYFNANGTMASNTEVDGYTLGSNGAWVQ